MVRRDADAAAVEEALARAIDALGQGKPAATLDYLLYAWRRCRAPALAQLIESLDVWVERGHPVLVGRTRAALHERWLDVEALGRPIDLCRLLAPLTVPPAANVLRRLERLELRPADPRIASRLVEMAVSCPFKTTQPTPWSCAFAILHAIGDPRGRGRLERFVERQTRQLHGQSRFFRRQLARVQRLLRELAPPPTLAKEATTLGARLAEKLAALAQRPPEQASLVHRAPPAYRDEPGLPVELGDERARLLGLVLQDPADDEARQVYGDWLLERGDARGELIALQYERRRGQLARRDERRERELLRDHGRRWLGEIEPAIDPASIVYDRGFLSRCRVVFQTPRQRRELLSSPLWATVEQIEAEPALLAQPALRGLRVVRGLSVEGLRELLALGAPLPQVQRLAVTSAEGFEPSALATIAAAGVAFPRLRALTLRHEREGDGTPPIAPEAFAPLLDSALLSELDELALAISAPQFIGLPGSRTPRPRLAPWVGWLAARASAPQRLAFELDPFFSQTLARDGAGVSLRLSFNARTRGFWPGTLARALAGFRDLPKGALARVDVRIEGEAAPELHDALRAELAEHGPLTIEHGAPTS